MMSLAQMCDASCMPQMLDVSCMDACNNDSTVVCSPGMMTSPSEMSMMPSMMTMPLSMMQPGQQHQAMMMMGMMPSSFMCQMMTACKSNPAMCQMMTCLLRQRKCVPCCEIRDCGDCYTIDMECAGCTKQDIKVECLEGRTIMIKCERMPKMCQESESCLRMERQYGCFQRCIRMPENCCMEKIQARCENGLLCIQCPKNNMPMQSSKKHTVACV